MKIPKTITILQPEKKLLLIIFLVFLGMFYAQKIYFTTADLGRHIKNGEVFLERNLSPISTNYYSYTEPDFPSINHHWGTGVIFYYIWKQFGFAGLSVLNIFLYLSAFLFFFKTASSFKYAFFFSLLSVPLIVSRVEIRPEGFSFLFMGLFYYLLLNFQKNKISFKKLLIPVIIAQIFWVNIHIFFIIGPFLVGAFLLNSLINQKSKIKIKQYAILLSATIAASLINPFGLRGFLKPFTILRKYGYMIAENQSIFFMQSRFPNDPLYYHFEALFLILSVCLILFIRKQGLKKAFLPLSIISAVSILSWKMIRGIAIFGFFFIPIAAEIIFEITKHRSDKSKQIIRQGFAAISGIIIFAVFLFPNSYYSPFKKVSGFGLRPKANLSAEFFKQNRIQGPIFNNYDIGGYLIFHLFPEHKVFVDNRPESYSVSFFKNIYKPMQADEKKWMEMEKKYGFNSIYFYRRDNTQHAQPFLIRRINDPEWAPVFVDDYNIILLKRNQKNKTIIENYELPKSMFIISKQPNM